MDVLFDPYVWRYCGHFVVGLYCTVFGGNAMIVCMFFLFLHGYKQYEIIKNHVKASRSLVAFA